MIEITKDIMKIWMDDWSKEGNMVDNYKNEIYSINSNDLILS